MIIRETAEYDLGRDTTIYIYSLMAFFQKGVQMLHMECLGTNMMAGSLSKQRCAVFSYLRREARRRGLSFKQPMSLEGSWPSALKAIKGSVMLSTPLGKKIGKR